MAKVSRGKATQQIIYCRRLAVVDRFYATIVVKH